MWARHGFDGDVEETGDIHACRGRVKDTKTIKANDNVAYIAPKAMAAHA